MQSQADQMAEVLEKSKKTIHQRDKAVAELDAVTKQLEESKRWVHTLHPFMVESCPRWICALLTIGTRIVPT